MNTYFRLTLLLMALVLPNLAWCWDDYSSSHNRYRPNYHSNNYARDHYSNDYPREHYRNGNRNERYEQNYQREPSPQEQQSRAIAHAQQQYLQAATEQKAEMLRLQTQYLWEKYRMENEAKLYGMPR